MTGTIEMDGSGLFFESFMFAEVDEETGKLKWMAERSVWDQKEKSRPMGYNSPSLPHAHRLDQQVV